MVQSVLKNLTLLHKVKIILPYNPIIAHLGIHPVDIKMHGYTKPEYIYKSFIYNHPKLEATKIYFSMSLRKLWRLTSITWVGRALA
jgi:hypothetical protein